MTKLSLIAMALIVASNITFTVNAKPQDTYLSEEIQGYCVEIGHEYFVAPEILLAMIETESAGVSDAENNGCKGLMQVCERYHKDRMDNLMVTDIYDEYSNILVATDYLMELAYKYGDIGYVLDVYHGDSKAKYNYENGILSNYAEEILERSAELERLHGK